MLPGRSHSFLVFLLAVLFAGGTAFSQMTITGSISGTVLDPSGQVVPDAKVTITSQNTKEARSTASSDAGAFSFQAVTPDTYSLRITRPGFKTFERTGVVVTANERIALGDILLTVGAVSETITVEAQVARVSTDSSEQSAQITLDQIGNLTARGREVVSLLRTIPGVSYQADQDSAGGSYGTGTPNIRGSNAAMNILAVDGVVSNDMGTPSVFSSVTTMDAIGEVKVVLNSYQAEYAGNGGTVVQVVSKSGGTEFHGNAYYYGRNDAFNANDFFNNRNKLRRPVYRYNTFGFSLGGPLYVPRKFNADKRKLFGYFNFEQLSDRYPGALKQYTMPNALERQGDFSQTFDTTGALIPITDPTTHAPFPGNIIPRNRLDANGIALMKMLPLPNYVRPEITRYNYNYQIQEVLNQPKRSNLFKVDWVPHDKDRLYFRGKTWLSEQQGYAVASGATPVGFFAQCYCFSEEGIATGWTHVFGPSIVMEVSSGLRHNHEGWIPYMNPITTVQRAAAGFKTGQWYPQSNPDDIIPRFSFNVPSSPNVGFDDRFLKNGTDFTFSFNQSVTLTRGHHTLKAGWSYYRMREYEGERSTFSGLINFSKDTNNPLDTNWAFANAALGIFQSYSESNARWGANERQAIAEWFLQDTWKITRRLTLDYGIRFSWANQMYPHFDGQQSVLALSRYDRKKAPVLYQPVIANGVRSAQNPLTGQVLPQAFVGTFVPGSGDPANGGVLSGDASYPRGFVNQQPVHAGPRFGFAYDVFGNGKTAIRGGIGLLYNMRFSVWSNTTNNPPAVLTPITYYGTLATLTQTAGVFAPSNTNAYYVDGKTPRNYNYSVAVQQDLGHALLMEVTYAGVLGRALQQSYNINTVPYGARFLPQNTDPTTRRPLADNFFRPYPGYNNVNFTDNAFSSNYHALLVSLNRRFSKGLQLGVAYAYSKFMNYTGIPVYRPLRVWSYGLDGADQTHNMSVNFTYALPKASRALPIPAVKYALDGWELSGIAQFVTGTPVAVGFSTVDGTDMVGGGDGQRIRVVGDSFAGGHTFYHWFNPAAFARPGTNDPGNAGKYTARNPGVNNFDLVLSKRFNVRSEKRYFEFRWEAYNCFNHTQYSGLNATARFDVQGNQVNGLFGQVTSTRTPRVMQAALRLVF